MLKCIRDTKIPSDMGTPFKNVCFLSIFLIQVVKFNFSPSKAFEGGTNIFEGGYPYH